MSALAPVLVALLFLALPLGTAPLEIATGLVVALAVGRLIAARRGPDPELTGPLLLITTLWLVSALAADAPAGEAVRAALGPLWALILAPALPALTLSEEARERALRTGLGAAAMVGAGALLVALIAGPLPWEAPARGLFSHHLTLGYAMLPPLAVALARRAWLPALGLVAGVIAAWSSGPALGLAVVVLGLALGPLRALVGGLALAVFIVVALRADPALYERALLWTSGAQLALGAPLGVSAAGFREAVTPVQEALAPDLYFPLHAHDAAIQRAAVGGFGAWAAWGWLLVVLWGRTTAAGKAALGALLVGGLTQDTLGDLEVVRALIAWALILAPAGTSDEASGRTG